MPTLLTIVLASLLLVQGTAFLLVWGRVRSARGSVGRPLHGVRAKRDRRLAQGLAILTVTVAATLALPPAAGWVLAAGSIALLLTWLALEPRDELVGADGARQGWNASSYGDVESWRLIGEHLRWKRDGQWFAASLPVDLHGEVRKILEARAPGREDAYGK